MIPVGTSASASSGAGATSYTIHSHDAEALTVANPISNTDMWSWIGAVYGSTGNFTQTSVVNAGGANGKVIRQFHPAGAYVDTPSGITLTGTPLARSVNEAYIDYDFRFVSGGSFGWGGKLPGLGGKLPSVGGNPPTGGTPSPYGWSGRMMWLTPGSFPGTANSPAELAGYIYDPTQAPGSYGVNRWTDYTLAMDSSWHHLRVYYKMNTVTVEGNTSPPADGIHRIWVDGVLKFENTAQVFRFYAGGNITHMVYDIFYGGDSGSWAPSSDTNIDIDNLVISTPEAPGAPPPPPDATDTGFEGSTVGATMTASNQGTGDALSLNTFVGTPTRQYVSTDVCNGTRALRVTGAAATTWRFYYQWGQAKSFGMRMGFVLKATPSSEQEFFALIEGTSFDPIMVLRFGTDRSVKHANALGTVTAIPGFTATLNTAYRIEAYGTLSDTPTTSNGTLTVKVFAGNSPTALVTFSSVTYNLGTVGIIRNQWGKLTSAGTLDMVFDDLATRVGSALPIGPAA